MLSQNPGRKIVSQTFGVSSRACSFSLCIAEAGALKTVVTIPGHWRMWRSVFWELNYMQTFRIGQLAPVKVYCWFDWNLPTQSSWLLISPPSPTSSRRSVLDILWVARNNHMVFGLLQSLWWQKLCDLHFMVCHYSYEGNVKILVDATARLCSMNFVTITYYLAVLFVSWVLWYTRRSQSIGSNSR